MIVCFTVPGEARGQGRPRATVRGSHASVYEREEDRSYKGLVQFHAMSEMRRQGLTVPAEAPDKGYRVSIVVVKAVPRTFTKRRRAAALSGAIAPRTKPDLDNIAKIYLDALNGVVWRDDAAVTELTVTKAYGEVDKVSIAVRSGDVDPARTGKHTSDGGERADGAGSGLSGDSTEEE